MCNLYVHEQIYIICIEIKMHNNNNKKRRVPTEQKEAED